MTYAELTLLQDSKVLDFYTHDNILVTEPFDPRVDPPLAFDYRTLADAVGMVELGVDTYGQTVKLINSAGDVVPGPIGLGLIYIQTGIDHGDESLTEFGYYLIARATTDAVVDAVAAGVAGALYGEIGGPPGVVAGLVGFVVIELAGGEVSDPLVDAGWKALSTDKTPVIVPYDPENPRVRTPPASTPSVPEPVGTPLPPGWNR